MNYALVAAGAEEAEEIDEEVDEVEVERKGADCCDFVDFFEGGHFSYMLDSLGVPGGDADENQHTDAGDNPFEGGAFHKEVDDDADDESEEGHIEECSHLGEVAVGEVAIHAHRSIHTGCDKESFENRSLGVNGEDQ